MRSVWLLSFVIALILLAIHKVMIDFPDEGYEQKVKDGGVSKEEEEGEQQDVW